MNRSSTNYETLWADCRSGAIRYVDSLRQDQPWEFTVSKAAQDPIALASAVAVLILAFVDADCIVSEEWLRNASVYFNDMEVVAWGGPPVPPQDASWVQKTWFLITQKENKVQDVGWLGTIDLFRQ